MTDQDTRVDRIKGKLNRKQLPLVMSLEAMSGKKVKQIDCFHHTADLFLIIIMIIIITGYYIVI